MAGKTLINGTAYDISGGKTLVNGTAYSIAGGKTMVGGTNYNINFSDFKPVTSLNIGNQQGILLAGKAKERMVIEADVKFVDFENTGTRYIISASGKNGSNYRMKWLGLAGSPTVGTQYYTYACVSGQKNITAVDPLDGKKHIHRLELKSATLVLGFVDNNGNGNAISSTGYSSDGQDIGILCHARNPQTSTGHRSSILYAVRVWEDQGATKTMQLIPVVRKSDNVAGMLDTMNGIFYTNAGIGTITYNA